MYMFYIYMYMNVIFYLPGFTMMYVMAFCASGAKHLSVSCCMFEVVRWTNSDSVKRCKYCLQRDVTNCSSFNVSFTENCKETYVPHSILTLVTMILYGTIIMDFPDREETLLLLCVFFFLVIILYTFLYSKSTEFIRMRFGKYTCYEV